MTKSRTDYLPLSSARQLLSCEIERLAIVGETKREKRTRVFCGPFVTTKESDHETMSKHLRASHPIYNLLPTEIDGFDSLAELALDLRSSWDHATDGVWRQLDPELWEITHNPWTVLQTASGDQIEGVLSDPTFRKNVDELIQTQR